MASPCMPWALPTRTLKFYAGSFHDDATLNSRTTLEVYSQARTRAKQEAQQRLVELIMPDDTQIMMKAKGVRMRVWTSLTTRK